LNLNYEKDDINRLYFSFISIAGLFALIFLVISAPNQETVFYLQKPIILSIFILICLMGMVAAVSPSWCIELSSLKKDQNPGDYEGAKQKKFSGHHPECENFMTHTYTLRGRKYCAGCSGLFIGAIIGILGTIAYYFIGLSQDSIFIIFFTGILMVLLSLLQNLLFIVEYNTLKFFLNLMLVVGSFFILIGTVQLNNSLFIQVFFLLLVIIWILTRISSSERNHTLICEDCGKGSRCGYR
jgi:hypothetical protein